MRSYCFESQILIFVLLYTLYRKHVTPEFFRLINVSLHCSPNCPLNLGVPETCSMTPKRDRLVMFFRILIVDPSLHLAVADPFQRMYRNKSTCGIKYDGPTTAVVSTRPSRIRLPNIPLATE